MVQLRMREKVCMQSVSNERRIRSSIQQTIFFCLFLYIHSFVFHLQMQEHLASMLLCASVPIESARKMKREKNIEKIMATKTVGKRTISTAATAHYFPFNFCCCRFFFIRAFLFTENSSALHPIECAPIHSDILSVSNVVRRHCTRTQCIYTEALLEECEMKRRRNEERKN